MSHQILILCDKNLHKVLMKYTVIIILCGIFIDLKCIVKYGSKKYDYNETTRAEKSDSNIITIFLQN